jgi:hypothetical protein
MFAFIQAWSGQSGSGFVPHSPAPLAFPPPPAEPLAAAVALPASVAPPGAAAGPASFAFVVVPLPLGAVFVAAADSVATAVALAAGALETAGGGTEDAEGLEPVPVSSDFVHAKTSAASERITGKERMGGELTRNRI